MKERLIEFLSYYKISKTEFGNAIGASNAFVTSIRKSISPDKIQSIALNYPQLNIDWLLTGEGKMLKDDYNSDQEIISLKKEIEELKTTIIRLQAENDVLREVVGLNKRGK